MGSTRASADRYRFYGLSAVELFGYLLLIALCITIGCVLLVVG